MTAFKMPTRDQVEQQLFEEQITTLSRQYHARSAAHRRCRNQDKLGAKAPRLPIYVTMGEPAASDRKWRSRRTSHWMGGRTGGALKLVGDPDVFRACGEVPDDALIATDARAKRNPGKLNVASAPAVIGAIDRAVRAAMDGEAAAVVTAPIHKSVLTQAGFQFPGHTEYLAHLTGAKRAVMMLASDILRVVPLTIHIPLREVAARHFQRGYHRNRRNRSGSARPAISRCVRPRLAIAGLNPHAGEAGTIGREEETVIAPAIAALRRDGTQCARAAFRRHDVPRKRRARGYDAALCMYHDQALIPMKTLAFWDGVNVTLGLPIVRTSPDHGTALDIAGTGKADPRSMIAAISSGGGDSRSRVDDGLPPLREVIAAHGLAAKKSLGQNFLLDLNLTRPHRARGGTT